MDDIHIGFLGLAFNMKIGSVKKRKKLNFVALDLVSNPTSLERTTVDLKNVTNRISSEINSFSQTV